MRTKFGEVFDIVCTGLLYACSLFVLVYVWRFGGFSAALAMFFIQLGPFMLGAGYARKKFANHFMRTETVLRTIEIFGHDRAVKWLNEPNPSLSGKKPYDVMQTPEGVKEVENVLTRIEHGVVE